jgi:hypothetical protein
MDNMNEKMNTCTKEDVAIRQTRSPKELRELTLPKEFEPPEQSEGVFLLH